MSVERYRYGYCEDPNCPGNAQVTQKKAQWRLDGVALCSECLRRRERTKS